MKHHSKNIQKNKKTNIFSFYNYVKLRFSPNYINHKVRWFNKITSLYKLWKKKKWNTENQYANTATADEEVCGWGRGSLWASGPWFQPRINVTPLISKLKQSFHQVPTILIFTWRGHGEDILVMMKDIFPFSQLGHALTHHYPIDSIHAFASASLCLSCPSACILPFTFRYIKLWIPPHFPTIYPFQTSHTRPLFCFSLLNPLNHLFFLPHFLSFLSFCFLSTFSPSLMHFSFCSECFLFYHAILFCLSFLSYMYFLLCFLHCIFIHKIQSKELFM